MPTVREGAGVVLGGTIAPAVLLLFPGEERAPVEHRPQGGVQDDMTTVRDHPDAGTDNPLVVFDRKDEAGVVVDRPAYSAQYIANALAACDKAEAEGGGGYVAPKRARWEALAAEFAARGIPLPLTTRLGAEP